MWVVLDYEPVAIFGLRPSNTTSSGGKSLLVPTPYAIKMALIDRALRHLGQEQGRMLFPYIRDCRVFVQAPQAVAVTRSFQKVLRPNTKKGEVWTSTIAQREYVVYGGTMRLALNTDNREFADVLIQVASMVNYFGRKGSFFQLIDARVEDMITDEYVDLGSAADLAGLRQMGLLQRMDDMRADATFDEISTLSKKGNKDDGGRISYTVILPYQLMHNGHNYTVYEVRR